MNDSIQIKNGRVVDPQSGFDAVADVFVADGRIVGIGQAPAGFVAASTLAADGLVVCPGLVDLSARVGNLESELGAAVAGGITAVACPPDTDPPLDEPELVERLVRHAAALGLARVHPLGALTQQLAGEKLAELCGLAKAGCIGFTQARQPLIDTQVLLRAMQYAATFGFAIGLQPQDYYLGRDGVAHDGEVASRLGLSGIPVAAETVAVATALQLTRETGARLHLNRLSSAAALDLVRSARAAGLAVTCDVAVHHLHLSETDIGYFDSRARFAPPLRAESDRAALRAAVAEGLAAVCSDHTPVDDDGKALPFGEAEPGASALELLLPLTLQWAAEDGLPLARALARVTCDPAAVLGIDGGVLAVGKSADLCLFAPDEAWTVSAETLRSEGKNTPFLGVELHGRVRHTLVDGRLVYSA